MRIAECGLRNGPPTPTVRLSSTLSVDRRELTAEALPLSFDLEALDGEGGGKGGGGSVISARSARENHFWSFGIFVCS